MTLPSSGTITMAEVATELGLSDTGINLNHSWVRALANIGSGAIALSSLYGKTGNFSGTLSIGQIVNFVYGAYGLSIPFFGCTINEISQHNADIVITITGSPTYTGNVIVTDNTTGKSSVLSWTGQEWENTNGDLGWGGRTANDNVTVYPHS
jgi:hypothetical protein